MAHQTTVLNYKNKGYGINAEKDSNPFLIKILTIYLPTKCLSGLTFIKCTTGQDIGSPN